MSRELGTEKASYDASSASLLAREADSGDKLTIGPASGGFGRSGIYMGYYDATTRVDFELTYSHGGRGGELCTPTSGGYDFNCADNTAGVDLTGGAFRDLLVGGSGRDVLDAGGGDHNLMEGGAGADRITGRSTTDIASYKHSVAGVSVNLSTGVGRGGDAAGDKLTGIENILGSANADTLTGDTAANLLIGGGGADRVFGMGGDDRIVIADTPTSVDGGSGNDTLAITKGGAATLDDRNFTNIENVFVEDGASVDMTGVTGAPKAIRSLSSAGHGATIVGSSGADRIFGGGGGDSITGGLGDDRIFAGTGNETFNDLMAGFGRDVILHASLAHDTFDVSGMANSRADLHFASIDNSADTLVTGVQGRPGDGLVLKGLTMADVEANGHFLTGADHAG